jgi:hypothetical protein
MIWQVIIHQERNELVRNKSREVWLVKVIKAFLLLAHMKQKQYVFLMRSVLLYFVCQKLSVTEVKENVQILIFAL